MKPTAFHWEKLGMEMAQVFRAFGDVNRMKIIKILASNPEESVCVSDLAGMLKITQPAASQHIRVLKSVGILVPKRQGNRTFYSIDCDRLREYKDIIDHMFKMAFVKCTYEGDCDNCPVRRRCGE
jgi:ArsR family transcriptional regulator